MTLWRHHLTSVDLSRGYECQTLHESSSFAQLIIILSDLKRSDRPLRDFPLYLYLYLYLTRAPLGYFFFITRPTGGLFRTPLCLRNYWTDSKNSSGIWKPWKNCRSKTNFIDLGVTSDVTGQVKVKMFDISGLVTSASKIAMLSTKKAT